MALLTLKDIGKIYVSEGNVAVGIRGVNLSFDRGEFVAVTGKSGSGKSTLLNIISGMDSYEEGELYIEGQTTSHYLQPEWEEYREKYISFIFQDYNIIESFTVLENVELALMHIEDKKERRARAMALIERVGLSSHIKHKGSKLSGGQKQRTVIARALAKDSPIILADEPTGNLDSQTSKEIIELLREVSKDKLLIVVTHNFEQVAEHATRHVRIFDGSIEADHTVRTADTVTDAPMLSAENERKDKKKEAKRLVKNGFTLGRTMFLSRPKLSVFLCVLMIAGTLGLFLVTAMCGDAGALFKPNYMFNHIDGRVVIAKQSGEVFSEDELEGLCAEYGASEHMRFDKLLDEAYSTGITIQSAERQGEYNTVYANAVYGKHWGDDVVGRYPKEQNEVLLRLPISYQPVVGKDSVLMSEIEIGNVTYELVGASYYCDNNLTPECLYTEEGFRVATAVHFISQHASNTVTVAVKDKAGKAIGQISLGRATPSFDMPKGKIYIDSDEYRNLMAQNDGAVTLVSFSARYNKYNYHYGSSERSYVFEKTFGDADITAQKPDVNYLRPFLSKSSVLYISADTYCEISENVLDSSYAQASLFFDNDRDAHVAAEKMQQAGYIAVPSDTEYEPAAETVILTILSCVVIAFVWIISVVFLAFFINLCSSRTIAATKGDLAIMRSMGIPVSEIRVSMYVRMLFSLIPAFVLVVLVAVLVYTTPKFNAQFAYLYAWQYALMFIGMIALTVRTTSKQIKKMFGESVKKSLRGGAEQ